METGIGRTVSDEKQGQHEKEVALTRQMNGF
jgi:hypothetical protein